MAFSSSISTLGALNGLNRVTASLNKSYERLSTGYKINRASDGAANLLISENMRSQIRGMQVAIQNSEQGVSMLDIADGALQQVTEHLQRIREIAVGAMNSTTSTTQYASYQAELQSRLADIDRIASGTTYGTSNLLDGTAAAITIQTGANTGAANQLTITTAFSTATSTALGVTQNTLASVANASALMAQVDTALGNVANKLATIGGFQNRLNDNINYLSVGIENYTAAEASIRNTDIATETSNLTRLQILQQASISALAQANSSSSALLRLLQ